LLALSEGAGYSSANYLWFAERYRKFIYVDRVVVASAEQGKRLGQLLYDDLFAFARDRHVALVTCEFYIDPPNEASRRFHSHYGFREVGRQWVAGGKKQVSLQLAEVPAKSELRWRQMIQSDYHRPLCLMNLAPQPVGFYLRVTT